MWEFTNWAGQSLNKTDNCLELGFESLFASIDKRDLQGRKERETPIGRGRFI
jgi:hypothetical protein